MIHILGDFIEDQEATSPAEHAASEMLKEQLEDVLDTFDLTVKKMSYVYVLV